jgi:hypothetical protein
MTKEEFEQMQDAVEQLLLSGEQENIDTALAMTRRGEMQLVEAALRKKYKKLCGVFGHSFERLFTCNQLHVQVPIRQIPLHLERLQKVKKLFFNISSIGCLLEGICEMRQLEYLYLPNCGLACLPENIGNLSNLCFLQISNNDISSLPQSLKKIPNLHLVASNTRLNHKAVFEEFTNIKELIYSNRFSGSRLDFSSLKR